MTASSEEPADDIDAYALFQILHGASGLDTLLAADSPIGARDLAERADVSPSSTYRRVKELSDAGGLLTLGTFPTETDGRGWRQETHYVRPSDRLVVDFSGDNVTAHWAGESTSEYAVNADSDDESGGEER